MKKTVRIGITLGDVNGIGPEVALKAACGHRWPANLQLILIGAETVLRKQCHAGHLPMPAPWKTTQRSAVAFWDPTPKAQPACTPGKVRVPAAQAAAGWIRAAVDACLDGSLDGMVTAPIC